jgi:hypothetical protein
MGGKRQRETERQRDRDRETERQRREREKRERENPCYIYSLSWVSLRLCLIEPVSLHCPPPLHLVLKEYL